MAKATKARQAQSRLKELERMQKVAQAHVDSPFSFTFPAPGKVSDPLLTLSDASLGHRERKVLLEVSLLVSLSVFLTEKRISKAATKVQKRQCSLSGQQL